MQNNKKPRNNPLDLLGGPPPTKHVSTSPANGGIKELGTSRPATAPANKVKAEKTFKPPQDTPKPAQPQAPTPQPTMTAEAPVTQSKHSSSARTQGLSLPEYDRSPVHLLSLLAHHLKYYGFAPEDQDLLEDTLELMNHDVRCKDRNDWLVFSPVGRDFLLVTNDKELSRAAQTKGSAVRLNFLDLLQEEPFPLGQLLLFREEFSDFFRPCSHLIALQVMSKNLVKDLYENPVSREFILNVKHAVAAIFKKRNRPLTLHRLQAISLAVIAEGCGYPHDWTLLKDKIEQLVLSICQDEL